ncbi:TolC family protein [Pleionea sp. CnH1-48]|uniref:TolC family protein n=1 Tax=Pleionea sp. CnH1-48 TaxID=2954494 RepID=UPI0020978010|nr:TolC family protein [Pleionea sp. CnH1-48]MCO7224175.1 TolC family protein [Pleionea sp. CnH1-48]
MYYTFMFQGVSRPLATFGLVSLFWASFASAQTIAPQTRLESVVLTAINHDLELKASEHRQNMLEASSQAADTLPDPRISLGIMNIAADSFDFAQEPMTQLSLGLSQKLPRGNSRQIQQQHQSLLASQQPLLRQLRQRQLVVTTASWWLALYQAQQSIHLIQSNRALFEQLADIAQANYSSTIGNTRQQDIVQAQLELTRLNDRLQKLKQQQETARLQLSQWTLYSIDQVPTLLPNVSLYGEQWIESNGDDDQKLYQRLLEHPSVLALEQSIKAKSKRIELAKQKYRPEWGFNIRYGYRDDTPQSLSRSDLLSVGISFDIPLYGHQRQDSEVAAAAADSAITKTDKALQLRKLVAAARVAQSQYKNLQQRRTLYRQQLLPQTEEQAEAALTAYTNDDGSFADVVRSRITALTAQLDMLTIEVERLKQIIQFNYFFAPNANTMIQISDPNQQPAGSR